ncbi:hypothetical protein IW140_004496 [Coemansia sp. RSA 1813]|nr:hypothetical protein EV178_004689 [Coemansia sp. RSA 1646]KAJ1771158.1 hypothetical protein LPJ74_002547 [Coemansia sp. RSA 1843]KAJ2087818.1 hypothetical protein IW138_004713 [Coemansia sp. RSA 986]KAJ2212711.1 hypothetical protein EV179_004459 [Coemansia sp. RSA 487]KAJ2567363.1 hypothetical protein IW140_004496 [Coemansia sp. RSA 1813]
MPSYTLRYFDIPARAEPAKVILLLSGADWKYEPPKWPQDKDAQPVGKLPVLIESPTNDSDADPFVLSETAAIEYYLATTLGFIYQPKDPKIVAHQLELRSHIADMYEAFVHIKYSIKETAHKNREAFKSTAGYLVRLHEKALKENGSNGHYFGSTTSLVDIHLFASITTMRTKFSDFDSDMLELLSEENAPEINKVIGTVASEPALAAYVAETKQL